MPAIITPAYSLLYGCHIMRNDLQSMDYTLNCTRRCLNFMMYFAEYKTVPNFADFHKFTIALKKFTG